MTLSDTTTGTTNCVRDVAQVGRGEATSASASGSIPQELIELDQWVVWKHAERKGTPTKVPFQLNGIEAKSNDPETWTTYEQAVAGADGYEGVGFMFSASDDFCGIDLDGCRDPATGIISEWAANWIDSFNSYTEISPSQTGVKIFVRGKNPQPTGKKCNVDEEQVTSKKPGVEIYDHVRYFAVTGNVLEYCPTTCEPRQEIIDEFCECYFPAYQPPQRTGGKLPPVTNVEERAAKYLATIPGAVAGSGGHNATFHVACVLVLDFDLSPEQAFPLISEWNVKCEPPWTEKELWHKLNSANDVPDHERGRLLNEDNRKHNGNEHTAVVELGDNTEQVERPLENARAKITFERITAAELASGDYRTEYLIEGTMTAGQPMIVAGGKKQLKTNILCDLGISLATGGLFLGRLKVNRAARVGIMSGESGMGTIQETCLRICKSKDVELQDIEGLIFSSDLPRLDDLRYIVALEEFITNDEIEVLILDPAYLMMPGGDAGNLFVQGELLRNISKLCERLGVTMVLCHHTKKGVVDPYAPPELEDIAWAGFQEFARQWFLIGRREKYEPGTGKHALWLNIGGSAGHSALWGVNINEGVYRGPGTRVWDVELLTAEESREESVTKTQDAKQANKQRQRAADVKACKNDILNAFNGLPDHREVISKIKDRSGRKGVTFDTAFGELIREGAIKPAEVTRSNGQTYDGYERVYPQK